MKRGTNILKEGTHVAVTTPWMYMKRLEEGREICPEAAEAIISLASRTLGSSSSSSSR